MKPANTFDAHRLMKFARAHDKDYDLSEKIFFANFTKSKDIGNSEVLSELAVDVDRKSTSLNSSHVANSYANNCSKKTKTTTMPTKTYHSPLERTIHTVST